MACFQGFASHGGSILSGSWLATVEAPGTIPGINTVNLVVMGFQNI